MKSFSNVMKIGTVTNYTMLNKMASAELLNS